LKFLWAAKGDLLLDRDTVCAALDIDSYPLHTMNWTEWCQWLYRTITHSTFKQTFDDFSSVQVAVAYAQELRPWIVQRASVVEERKVSASKVPQKDGFSMVGFSNIMTESGKLWEVLQRSDSWNNNNYRLVMLIYRNTVVSVGGNAPVVEWGVLTQMKDDPHPSICDCKVEVFPKADAFSRYKFISDKMLLERELTIAKLQKELS